jgi:hypothetical protein
MYFLIANELLENLILAIFHRPYIQNSSAKKNHQKNGNICFGGELLMGSPVWDSAVGAVPSVSKGVSPMGKCWEEYACDM